MCVVVGCGSGSSLVDFGLYGMVGLWVVVKRWEKEQIV